MSSNKEVPGSGPTQCVSVHHLSYRLSFDPYELVFLISHSFLHVFFGALFSNSNKRSK